MVICSKCGKEYQDGTYHSIHCSVMFKDDRKIYDWNCFKPENLKLYKIEEKIISSYINNSKPKSLLLYE